MHAVKTAEDLTNNLVGTQQMSVAQLPATALVGYSDELRQLAASQKPPYNTTVARLCLLVVQLDCGDDAAPGVGQLFERLRCIFDELHEWVEKASGPLVMGATQLQALIVSRSVGPFWHAHMDASKEGKKKGGSS